MLSARGYTKNLPVVSGGNVQVAAPVERERPYIFGAWVEIGRGTPFAFGLLFFIFARGVRGVVLNFVDLAIGIGCRVEHAILVSHQRLYLQLLGLKDGRGLPS